MNTHAHSRKWMQCSVPRLTVALTSAACAGLTDSFAEAAVFVGEPWVMARGVLRCSACHVNTSLTAGTVFQDTRRPLRTWFFAMWFITSHKNGVSALGLQRVLGLGSCETAWTWMHKLRRAMVRSGHDLLTGEVGIEFLK